MTRRLFLLEEGVEEVLVVMGASVAIHRGSERTIGEMAGI